MDEKKIREAIDVCRPGSNDLSEPELAWLGEQLEQDAEAAKLYQRIQRLDAALGEAVRSDEVTPPEGLAERLLAALGQSPAALHAADLSEPAAESDEEAATGAAAEAEPAVSPAESSQATWSRRWWLAVAAMAACLLLAAAVAWRLWQPDAIGSAEELAERAPQWSEQLIAGDWEPVSAEIERRFPLDPSVSRAVQAYQPVETSYTLDAVAYSYSRRHDAVLFVLRTGHGEMLPGTPARPLSSYQGGRRWFVGAWKRDGLVYVLSVQGDLKRYYGHVGVRQVASL